MDPLEDLDIVVQSFDIPRTVSVYPDQAGIRWWTKAWFNNRKDGEASVEISRQSAILFIRNQVEKDEWPSDTLSVRSNPLNLFVTYTV